MTAAESWIGDEGSRLTFWRSQGASASEAAELVEYARSPVQGHGVSRPAVYPLAEERFVLAWERYCNEAAASGVWSCLRERLVQLRFPIEEGISATPTYRAATRRGILPDPDATPALELARPDGLRLFLHPTPAGRVPVIVAEEREDFESLVRALAFRNEPHPVPPSMGACIVAGYNNWDRVAYLRDEWRAEHAGQDSDEAWQKAFGEIVPQKALYQDRFILLSSGPYSAVHGSAVGLPEEEWTRLSHTIRLEHECTHYFTRQVFGSMRNSLLDELVADCMGLLAAVGEFRRDWFLLFMGLESHPSVREGGRIENYRGNPPLGPEAFAIVRRAVWMAAANLDRLRLCEGPSDQRLAWRARLITALTAVGIEGLASGGGEALIDAFLQVTRASQPGAMARQDVPALCT